MDNVAEMPEEKYVEVDDFLRLAVKFYNTLGIDPYETGRKRTIWFQIYFALNMFNMVFSFYAEVATLVDRLRDNENFLESCILLSYVSFVVMGLSKIGAVMKKKPKMTALVRQLETCFPSPSAKVQEEYAVKSWLKRCHIYTKGFGGLFMIMYFAHALIPLFIYFIQRVLLHYPDAKQIMPFYQLEPWEFRDSWLFYPSYFHQSSAGYTATCGSIAGDLMIFAVVLQVIMHYERLAKVLREFKIQAHNAPNGANEDIRKLQSLVANHIDILRLVDKKYIYIN